MASPEAGAPEWIGLAGVSLSYGHIAALNGVDFRMEPGEFHALLGNHNDGKSTLCRVLAGTAVPSSGTVWVDGAARARYGVREASALGIEYLGDRAEIFPHLTVLENLTIATYGRSGRLFMPAAKKREIGDWLAGFGLKRALELPAADFSSEDKLLIKFLGCLHARPRLVILDETLERFPRARRLRLAEELRERTRAGLSVLWATHDLDDALQWADFVTILRNGRRYLTAAAGRLDRRSLIRMTYSATGDYSGDSRDDFENYYNLVRYSGVLLEHLPSAVLVMDAEERIRFVNASGMRLLSLAAAYHPGMPAADALERDNPEALAMVRESLRARRGTSADATPFHADRGRILVDLRVLAVDDGAGVLSAMLIIDDVSEREGMRRQLSVAHNLSSIGMLAAGVAHEVNNPLESIGNYISYLLRRETGEEIRGVLERMRKEADCIRDIVTNLVMFSGKGETRTLEMDLAAAIRDIVDMLGYNSRYDDIEIDYEHPETPLVIRMDPNEFRQIILNLLRNSMEAMPKGGAIVVRAAALGASAARLSVRDYGVGMEEGMLRDNEAFLPFVSGKAGDAGNQGLGLSIVYGLVKKWGGDITVGPAGPGTVFTIDLPLAGGAFEKNGRTAARFP